MGRRGPAASSTAEELLAQMTVEEKAGQMVMGLNARAGRLAQTLTRPSASTGSAPSSPLPTTP